MKAFNAADLRKRRIASVLLLSLLFLVAPRHSEAASSGSLVVKVRQLNPDGKANEVTCAVKTKCHVPLVISAGPMNQEKLDVSFDYFSESLIFVFHTSKGYLYAADKNPSKDGLSFYNTIWPHKPAKDKPATYIVTLFLPAVERMQGPMLNIAREAELKVAHETVADLEITTQPRP